MTHVRIRTMGGDVDTNPIPLPFVPLVGDVIVWEDEAHGRYRVVSRWLYCYRTFPSATLIVERDDEPPTEIVGGAT